MLFEDKNGSLWVRDLQSRNGTFADGKKISMTILKAGDDFQIGTTVIEVVEFVHAPAVSMGAERDEEKTHGGECKKASETTYSPEATGIVNSWPEAFFCVPKEKQERLLKPLKLTLKYRKS